MGRLQRTLRQSRDPGNPQLLYDRLEDFAVYGLDMAGAEFHIQDNDGFVPTDSRRAEMTEEITTAYFSHPQGTGLNCWTYHLNDPTHGPLINNNGSFNLNGLVWYYLNRIRYATAAALVADESGQLSLRGFTGDCDVVVRFESKEYATTLVLDSDVNQQLATTIPQCRRQPRYRRRSPARRLRSPPWLQPIDSRRRHWRPRQ